MYRWWPLSAFLFAGILAVVGGCSLYGPQLTPPSHLAYNEAVQQTEQRELLLNLVRLRYLDGPEFLSISSISSQMRFDAAASLSGDFGDDGGSTARLITPGASVQYSESPTITFVPQHDDEFMRRLVSPISLDSLYLLTRYGWSLERVLSLISEEVNGFRNPAPREEVSTEDRSDFVQFARLARTMQQYHDRHWIDIDAVDEWLPLGDPVPSDRVSIQDYLNAADRDIRLAYDSESTAYTLEARTNRYVLQVASEARESTEFRELLDLLGLQPGSAHYDIDSTTAMALDRESITIRTRSVLSAMASLSNGVSVPGNDLTNGTAGRNVLDAQEGSVPIRILSAPEPPTNAFLSVPYRGSWFFIDMGDLDSRRTLGALSSLVRLEIGAGGDQIAPVLTLPVAR